MFPPQFPPRRHIARGRRHPDHTRAEAPTPLRSQVRRRPRSRAQINGFLPRMKWPAHPALSRVCRLPRTG
jgi:hypothetical protein